MPKSRKRGVKVQFVEKRFVAVLNSHGNSIVEVRDNDLVKVHIHTLNPGNILSYAQQFGEFVKIKVENMSEQHSELLKEENKRKIYIITQKGKERLELEKEKMQKQIILFMKKDYEDEI